VEIKPQIILYWRFNAGSVDLFSWYVLIQKPLGTEVPAIIKGGISFHALKVAAIQKKQISNKCESRVG
jgi:hypothetical protein